MNGLGEYGIEPLGIASALWKRTHTVEIVMNDADEFCGPINGVRLLTDEPALTGKITKRTQFDTGDRMTSLRQIQANRRNARLSTGPVTEEGKKRSRRNAVRHGLTAETVIDALEDAEDYAAFEMSITADYEAQSAVERELVLRLASLLWRLRRATAIESGLFKMQARQLLQFRQRRRAQEDRQKTIEALYRTAVTSDDGTQLQEQANCDAEGSISPAASEGNSDDLTRSFVRLSNLPNCPLDRLSRYEGTLWRQACQILFALQFLGRHRPWERMRPRMRL